MLTLRSSITSISGVGERYKKLFNNLDIYNVKDLLYHFPYRFDDYSKIKDISQIKNGETLTLHATLESINNIFTRNGKKLTKAIIRDHSGSLNVIWFNQHYILRTLKVGEMYSFSGKVEDFSGKLTLISPEYEDPNKHLNTGRLVPIYKTTAGVTQKFLRTRINDVLAAILPGRQLSEFLPQKLIEMKRLKSFSEALEDIHKPNNIKDYEIAKRRFCYEELFTEILRIVDLKNEWKQDYVGVKLNYETHKTKINDFIKSLPFSLTTEQNKVIEEIVLDLDKAYPMNRLIEGDVGTGKTIIAIIASYLCYLSGYKVLYMAPTELLARQHYETYTKFLHNYVFEKDIKLRTSKSKQDITRDDTDIVIGTHALLYESTNITNVGLIIIDEQHRFGVHQRTKLIQMGKGNATPNILSMTATPIPRSLALALYGELDLSIINQAPNINKKIVTRVVSDEGRAKLFDWIREKGEQTFIVCPFIEQSEASPLLEVKAAQHEYEVLSKSVFKGIPVGLLHGKLKQTEKDKVLQDFRDGSIQVLISTPVIEVGVDVPEATVMVIESAERYGLASLHQLRGRVGRGQKNGYCFLVTSKDVTQSVNRLKHLEKSHSGLELAEIDLRYRGQGDMFGTMQHGFKRFKIADPNDFALIEDVKDVVQELYGKDAETMDYLESLKNTYYDLVERN